MNRTEHLYRLRLFHWLSTTAMRVVLAGTGRQYEVPANVIRSKYKGIEGGGEFWWHRELAQFCCFGFRSCVKLDALSKALQLVAMPHHMSPGFRPMSFGDVTAFYEQECKKSVFGMMVP